MKISLGLERFKTKLVPVSSSPVWGETGLLARHTDSESLLTLDMFARLVVSLSLTESQRLLLFIVYNYTVTAR